MSTQTTTRAIPTAGPWVIAKDAEGRTIIIGEASGDYEGLPVKIQVCRINQHSSMAAANAALISAAPDLLAACRECLAVVDDAYEATGHIRVCKSSEQRMRIEAALAKAEGTAK